MRISGAQVRIRTCIAAVAALGATAAFSPTPRCMAAVTTDVLVFAGQPDVPSNVTVKGNNAGSAGNVTFTAPTPRATRSTR
jgi:hypothetical protein